RERRKPRSTMATQDRKRIRSSDTCVFVLWHNGHDVRVFILSGSQHWLRRTALPICWDPSFCWCAHRSDGSEHTELDQKYFSRLGGIFGTLWASFLFVSSLGCRGWTRRRSIELDESAHR